MSEKLYRIKPLVWELHGRVWFAQSFAHEYRAVPDKDSNWVCFRNGDVLYPMYDEREDAIDRVEREHAKELLNLEGFLEEVK